jgi:hypothetical protein
MSAGLSVFSAAGSRTGAAATRSAWVAVAWFSSRPHEDSPDTTNMTG